MSKTGIAGIVLVAEALLKLLGVEFPEGTAASITEALAVIISTALLAYAQLTRKDLKFGLVRR
jgi:uncharacterized membrane protein YfcA